jgi:hypothetical protein
MKITNPKFAMPYRKKHLECGRSNRKREGGIASYCGIDESGREDPRGSCARRLPLSFSSQKSEILSGSAIVQQSVLREEYRISGLKDK